MIIDISKKKLDSPYKLRSMEGGTKDVDIQKRIATGMFNSHFYIDSDLDMTLPGCFKKSMGERGPQSKAVGNKICHLLQHDWKMNIARPELLDEREVDYKGMKVSGGYYESYFPDVQSSTDVLIKKAEGIYTAHSFGYQYDDIEVAERESPDKQWKKNWEKYYPLALNPEKADEYGYFFLARSVKMFEFSDVAMGANALTPFLGLKSDDGKSGYELLAEKMERIQLFLKNGKGMSDEGFQQLEMELLQLKQALIFASKEEGPSMKDTLLKQVGRESTDLEKGKKIHNFLTLIN